MDIHIGIQNVNRELVLETDEDAEKIAATIDEALSAGTVLRLTDRKGRRAVVPVAALAYIEFGEDRTRPVGFAQS